MTPFRMCLCLRTSMARIGRMVVSKNPSHSDDIWRRSLVSFRPNSKVERSRACAVSASTRVAAPKGAYYSLQAYLDTEQSDAFCFHLVSISFPNGLGP